MLRRQLDAGRRHEAGKRVVRLRQMRVHVLQHLVRRVRPGDRQHARVRLADERFLRPQTTGDDHLAVFRQGLADRVERLLDRRVDEAAGVDHHEVRPFVRRRDEVALGAQLGDDLLGIDQGFRAA